MSNNAGILIAKHQANFYVELICNPHDLFKKNKPHKIDLLIDRLESSDKVIKPATREEAVIIADELSKEFVIESGAVLEYGIIELELG